MSEIYQKKKIVFFVQIPPPIHGASLRNLSLVQSPYLNKRYTIKLIPLSFAKEVSDIGQFNFFKLWRLIKVSTQLLLLLCGFKYRSVYFTLSPVGGAFYRDIIFVSILKMFRVKRIYHIRGMGIDKNLNKNRLLKILYRWVFKDSYVVCLSLSHLNDFRALVYKKIFVVNNGIKLSKFSARVGYSSHGEKIKILFLSNYVVSKGAVFFIDTLIELRRKTVNFEAIMVGADGDISKDELEKYISEARMNNFIKVMGKVDDEKKKFDFYTWADIFFFPTYYPNEVFPGVVLEAMQSGCAVVSTNTGVIPDIIENNVDGLIGVNNDTNSFADVIANLINKPVDIIRLGKQAQISFKAKFTMEIFEENMHKVFNQIL